MTSSPGSMRAMIAAASPSMAPTVTTISPGSALMPLSRASLAQISSRRAGRPAVGEYPAVRPSRMAAIAASLMCPGVPEVGLAQERKATSFNCAESRVISWMAEAPIVRTRSETRASAATALLLVAGGRYRFDRNPRWNSRAGQRAAGRQSGTLEGYHTPSLCGKVSEHHAAADEEADPVETAQRQTAVFLRHGGAVEH